MVLPLPLQICKLKTQKHQEPKIKMVIITHIFYTNNFVSVPYTLSPDKIKVISHKNHRNYKQWQNAFKAAAD